MPIRKIYERSVWVRDPETGHNELHSYGTYDERVAYVVRRHQDSHGHYDGRFVVRWGCGSETIPKFESEEEAMEFADERKFGNPKPRKEYSDDQDFFETRPFSPGDIEGVEIHFKLKDGSIRTVDPTYTRTRWGLNFLIGSDLAKEVTGSVQFGITISEQSKDDPPTYTSVARIEGGGLVG